MDPVKDSLRPGDPCVCRGDRAGRYVGRGLGLCLDPYSRQPVVAAAEGPWRPGHPVPDVGYGEARIAATVVAYLLGPEVGP